MPLQAVDVVMNNGVIFKSEGRRSLTDSEWVIIAGITFAKQDLTPNNLKNWLLAKTQNVEKGSDITKFTTIMTDRIRSHSRHLLDRLEKNNEKYTMLRETISTNSNRPRGIVDGGGKTLHWMFGVTTDKELEKVNKKIELLSTENTAVVHALEMQASVVNETLWEVQANANTLKQLKRSYCTIEMEMSHLDLNLIHLQASDNYHWATDAKIDEVFR